MRSGTNEAERDERCGAGRAKRSGTSEAGAEEGGREKTRIGDKNGRRARARRPVSFADADYGPQITLRPFDTLNVFVGQKPATGSR